VSDVSPRRRDAGRGGVFHEGVGAPSITRRSLLKAGAGAFAGIALRPAETLAAQAGPPGVETIALGRLGQVRTIELPPDVAVAGLRWLGAATAPLQLRARLDDGRWGPWTSAGGHGHGPDSPSAALHTGDPLWVGGARVVELRSAEPVTRARLALVCGSATALAPDAAHAAALPLAQPVLAAGAGQPPIIARTAWAKGIPLPRVAPAYGEVKVAFVHHTENPNGYAPGQVPAMLRAIFLFHREVNGWHDIGYNFAVDRFGRIWEARAGGIDEPVAGAQAGGYNFESTGVAVLGSYSGVRISARARRSLQRLLAWKLSLHGTPPAGRVVVHVSSAGARYSKYPAHARVSLPRIAGHRDADATACPGDVLYRQLPGIRRRVRPMTAGAVRASLALVPSEPIPAQPVPPQPAPAQPPQLQVTLARLDGSPVAGAAVQLQSRTVSRRGVVVEHTPFAEALTDATGRCLLTASFAAGAPAPVWVRALYAGGPSGGAAVSQSVEVAPVPAPPVVAPPSG
jgi:hypothetical protein